MSALTDLIYSGSNAVAGLTEGAVNDAIAKYGEDGDKVQIEALLIANRIRSYSGLICSRSPRIRLHSHQRRRFCNS